MNVKKALLSVFLLLMLLNLAQIAQNYYLTQSLSSREQLVDELAAKLYDTALEYQASLSEIRKKDEKLKEQEAQLLEAARKIIALERNKEWIYVLGVSEGRGVVLKLFVERSPGEGRILVDTKNVLLETDVQSAMRNSLAAAQNLTGVKIKDDIVFTISNPLEGNIVLTGESAGAAMAIGILALIEDKEIRKDVVITGTITRDGKITLVSQIESKAQAAKEAGAKTLLVPEGQKIELTGLTIIEVNDLAEAKKYMLY